MLKEYTEFYVQKVESLKKPGLLYSINSNKKIIATLRQTKNSSNQTRNFLLKVFSLFFLAPNRIIIEEVKLELVDEAGELLGTNKKGLGLHKDFEIYSKNGRHLGTLISKMKASSPSILVVDANGDDLIKGTGRYGATDFSVKSCSSNKQISTIRKHSLLYETIKEYFFNNDVYHVGNKDLDKDVTLSLIAMDVAIDLYYHLGQ